MVREKSKYYNFQGPVHVYVVADASVFIWGKRPEGRIVTVPAVEAELLDIRTRSLLAIFDAEVHSPAARARRAAERAAEQTGDIRSLSAADLEVLALAIQYRDEKADDVVLATDDYALQNAALHIGLKIEPIGQPRIKRWLVHVQRCRVCGGSFEGEACPDCGTPAQRKKRCKR
ncbi:MAG TPA: hypothetical protein PKY93_07160 [Methanothrix sp.]|nr:hypothetical protein [Methanothrix sp.]HQI68486.1 hypothetical protein [Methanothrix sp.]HRS85432.1 hypothetical protein [Methanothrix sp.]HRT17475.1 hypothetical protein [Methanothrix sp.]